MTIIITLCSLLLIAYVFDISSVFTKIPSVFLLILLGWLVRQSIPFFDINIPDLNSLLPLLGTIGLILIVLESALELELNKSKFPIIKKSFLLALIPMIVLSIIIASLFHFLGDVSLKNSLVNAIPFCVISSAIAIPSVSNLSSNDKEFIIYESSLSDIFGVLFFNFVSLNDTITASSFLNFSWQILLIIFISFISVLCLSFLLSRIKHHVTYTPIILLVILIYLLSKIYHLPGLIFILVFGLFLGNLDEIKHYKWMEKFRPTKLDKEVSKFREISFETSFLIRTLFFILFGFLMNMNEILDTQTLPWAMAIVFAIVFVRWFALKLSKLSIYPLLYVAPRGLITILLFLSILPSQNVNFINKSMVIQVVLLSVLVMMFGLISNKKQVITID
ncbi:MAG: sodium:proton antiporter [Sphingobacteriaceae bacterium]|nr:sodium:proton antiporter [Sphingobacteriaceae bacterium]